MRSIFLNDPKLPKGPRFYLRALAILALIGLQLGVFFLLYQEEKSKQIEETQATDPPRQVTATAPPPPQALSIKDPDMQDLLNDYFGPLPQVQAKDKKAYESLYPVKGIYLGSGKDLEAGLELASTTEVNAFVIDVKESWGLTYKSQVPLAQEMGADSGTIDLPTTFARCHEAGVKVIARLVCFKDEVMPQARPDLCIQDKDGKLLYYPLEGGLAFADPYNPEVWAYLLDIAREVVAMGADEIQFDYVRFPTGSPESGADPSFAAVEEKIPKQYAINRFLETARIEIQEKLGVPISADLFSIVMSSEVDGQLIGQNWSSIGLTGIDCICPMIYPSHYANASLGSQGNGVGSYIGRDFFPAPDTEPYAVIENAIIDGERASKQAGYTRLRPWLQAFTASWLPQGYFMEYGGGQIRQQIDAVYAAGYGEWLLWDADYSYPQDAFMSQAEAQVQESQQAQASQAQAQELASEQASESAALAELGGEGQPVFPVATAPLGQGH